MFNPSAERSNESRDEILIVDQSRDNWRCNHYDAEFELAVDLGSCLSPISRSIFLILLDSNIISNLNMIKDRIKHNDKEINLNMSKFASDEMACMRTAATALGFAVSNTQLLYLTRLSASIVRDLTDSNKDGRGSGNQNHSLAERNNFDLFVAATLNCSDPVNLQSKNKNISSNASDNERVRVKPIPCSAEGISVLEFFSGIGCVFLALASLFFHKSCLIRKVSAVIVHLQNLQFHFSVPWTKYRIFDNF